MIGTTTHRQINSASSLLLNSLPDACSQGSHIARLTLKSSSWRCQGLNLYSYTHNMACSKTKGYPLPQQNNEFCKNVDNGQYFMD